jgi:hypothetical protein
MSQSTDNPLNQQNILRRQLFEALDKCEKIKPLAVAPE